MSDVNAPPNIFDAKLLKLRRLRASRRPASFLLKRCVEDAAERLMDINRNFENVLILGPETLGAEILSHLPVTKIGKITISETLDDLPRETNFDFVLSLLRLQSENDLPGAIIRLRQRLKPDGLFISSMFGGETLNELRQAFYRVDEELIGGLAPHIYPMADYSQAAGLMGRAGLNQPVIDTDRLIVSYNRLDRLISDLRDIGETNILTARQQNNLPKAYKAALTATYKEMYGQSNGKLTCTFEILWMTGWSPHDSQQKPLKPGTAKMSLKEGIEKATQKKS